MWIRALAAGLIAGTLAGGIAGSLVAIRGGIGQQPIDAELRSSLLWSETEQDLARLDKRIADAEDRSGALNDIDTRLQATEQRLEEMTRRAPRADIAGLVPHLEPLWARIDTLAERLDALERQVPATANATLEPFEERMIRLEQQIAGSDERLSARMAMLETRAHLGNGDGRIAAAALLLGELREALDQGAGFQAPLDRLGEIVTNDSFLASLVERMRPHAAQGVATMQDLQVRLDRIILADHGNAGSAPDWLARTLTNFESLVVVHRSGLAGDDPASIARERMANNDIAGAIEQLAPLAEQVGEQLALWLADARARLVVQEAAAGLDTAIRDLLATPSRS